MRPFNDSFFATSDRPVKLRLCDHPACGQAGDYRAPKNRDHLNEYYFFCLNHVREYNQAWDFFAGLKPDEVEAYTRDAGVWERPSWPMGQWGMNERKLRDKAMRDIFGDAAGEQTKPNPAPAMSLAERDALTVLKLTPPVDFTTIKAQYRSLVKIYHPDVHSGDEDHVEKFKDISQAFAVLRKIYTNEED